GVRGGWVEAWGGGGVMGDVDGMGGDCVESEGEAYRLLFAPLPIPSEYVSASMYTSAPWNRLLEINRPGRAPAGAPLYVAQGLDDPIVRPSVTADFVAGLCRTGATVRYDTFPGVGHIRAGRISATNAIRWMQTRFEGAQAPNTCPPL